MDGWGGGTERELEQQLRASLGEGTLEVWYQPKFSLVTGRMEGAEALVRWRRGSEVILPDAFLPALEATDGMVLLDGLVTGVVCRDILEARCRGLNLGNLSVNLSKANLTRPSILERVETLTGKWEITGKDLSFEITEGAARQSNRGLARLVEGLRKMEFPVQMDDFGAGGSDLCSLAQAPFDLMKLDRSLVALAGGERFSILLESILEMARRLEMEVVVEGVESASQAELLRRGGCRLAQGYYFSRPLQREDFFALAGKEGDR